MYADPTKHSARVMFPAVIKKIPLDQFFFTRVDILQWFVRLLGH